MMETIILLAGTLGPNNCDDAHVWDDWLKGQYHQEKVAVYTQETSPDVPLELWKNATDGSYTILAVPADDRRCYVTGGKIETGG